MIFESNLPALIVSVGCPPPLPKKNYERRSFGPMQDRSKFTLIAAYTVTRVRNPFSSRLMILWGRMPTYVRPPPPAPHPCPPLKLIYRYCTRYQSWQYLQSVTIDTCKYGGNPFVRTRWEPFCNVNRFQRPLKVKHRLRQHVVPL